MRPAVLLDNLCNRRVPCVLRCTSREHIPLQVYAGLADFHVECVVARLTVFRLVLWDCGEASRDFRRENVLARRIGRRSRDYFPSSAQRFEGLSSNLFGWHQ